VRDRTGVNGKGSRIDGVGSRKLPLAGSGDGSPFYNIAYDFNALVVLQYEIIRQVLARPICYLFLCQPIFWMSQMHCCGGPAHCAPFCSVHRTYRPLTADEWRRGDAIDGWHVASEGSSTDVFDQRWPSDDIPATAIAYILSESLPCAAFKHLPLITYYTVVQ